MLSTPLLFFFSLCKYFACSLFCKLSCLCRAASRLSCVSGLLESEQENIWWPCSWIKVWCFYFSNINMKLYKLSSSSKPKVKCFWQVPWIGSHNADTYGLHKQRSSEGVDWWLLVILLQDCLHIVNTQFQVLSLVVTLWVPSFGMSITFLFTFLVMNECRQWEINERGQENQACCPVDCYGVLGDFCKTSFCCYPTCVVPISPQEWLDTCVLGIQLEWVMNTLMIGTFLW